MESATRWVDAAIPCKNTLALVSPFTEKSSSAAVLERPLPWIPFLLLIVLLRLARIWLSLGALMIGNGPISPRDSIYFIQTRRRKLRAIRLHGLRVMRHRQQESSMRRVGKGFSQQLSLWLSRAICRPGVHQQEPQQQQVSSCPTYSLSPSPALSLSLFLSISRLQQVFQQSVSKRPRDEETQLEQNLTIDEILNSYANVNSEDDSDFVPNPEDESESSASDSDSESRSSDDISSSEVQEIAEEVGGISRVIYKPHSYTLFHSAHCEEWSAETLGAAAAEQAGQDEDHVHEWQWQWQCRCR